VFQPVPEPKRGKVRLYLDIAVTGPGPATRSAVELGASVADATLRVMRDPEGNELYLVHRADGKP
jgi:hypothetical protein